MSRLRAAASALLLLCLAADEASGWDAPWAVRRDAEVTPGIAVAGGATLPLASSPADVSALGLTLTGSTGYLDDDKLASLVVGALAAQTVWREQRERYEPSTNLALILFDLRVQLRVLPSLHLIYGAALARSGPRAHARLAVLCVDLGLALPLLGDRASMRGYRPAYLQVEALPLSASLLGFLDLEGFSDRELPQPGAAGEVALRGGLVAGWGLLEGDLRLTASYVQGSLYVVASLRYVAPVLFWRLSPLVSVEYVWPGRPLRGHVSEPGQRLLWDHHVGVFVGLVLRL